MRYFLPNRKTLSAYYQSDNIELPLGGAPLHLAQKWDTLNKMDTQETTRIFDADSLLWGLASTVSGSSSFVSGAGLSAGVWLQIFHIHKGKQRTLFNKPRPIDSVSGSGQNPLLLKPTYLFRAGDSVMIEVKSTDPTNIQGVELVLFCNRLDGGTSPNQYQQIVLSQKADMLESAVSAQPPATDAPPVDARPLVLTSAQLTAYPNPGAAPVTIFSYQVPPGQRARIKRHALVNLAGGQIDMTGNVIWRFFVNGAPLKGLGAQISTIGTFQTPDEVVIWLTENDQFQVTVEVPNGQPVVPGNTAYRIIGWTEPLIKGLQS